MRQIGKQILTIVAWALLVLMARADAGVTDIVTDPLTGVAIDGYDPVTYFTDIEPRPGRPDFEYVWRDVSWYFASAANRDAFALNPSVYAPQYGGHCLMSLSRGYLSDGKPRLYVLDGLKLYFFYSAANRDAFVLAKAEAIGRAEANWQSLSNGLPVDKPAARAPSSAGGDSASTEPSAAAPVAHNNSGDNVPAH